MNGRQENENKLRTIINEKLIGRPRYLKDYIQMLEANDKSMATIYRYLNHTIDFLDCVENEFGINCNVARNLKKIKSNAVNSYMIKQNNKSNSIKRVKFFAIKSLFSFLEGDGYISGSPCDKIKLKNDRSDDKIVYLTKDEIKIVQNNILTGCNGKIKGFKKDWVKRDLAIVMLALSTGLRRAALVQINLKDLNIDKSEVTVIEKGDKKRNIMYHSKLNEILIDWIKDREEKLNASNKECDALFISNRMSRISDGTVYNMIETYTYNLDKHITPHKLRATFATNAYQQTKDIYAVANALGHSNVATTKRYAFITDEQKRETANSIGTVLFD